MGEHLRLIEEVLKQVNNSETTVRLIKCKLFFSEPTDFLDSVIDMDRLQAATKSKKAIKALLFLTAVLESRSLLRLCNIY